MTSAPQTAPPFSPERSEQIRAHVNKVLASSAFAGSQRSREFLRYVVEETLAGRGDVIKERTIAMDVFGRGSEFNSQSESIVRVSAADVRNRLRRAYRSLADDDVRMELPVGAYHPVFQFAEPLTLTDLPVARRDWRSVRPGMRTTISALAVLLAAGLAVLLSHRASRSSVELFWQPFTNQRVPVLIALPSPTVIEPLHPSKWLPLRPQEAIPASDLYISRSYFVGVGAAVGAARIAEQLALRHQPFYLKFGEDVTFADLCQFPTILLGAYSSIWSVEMTQKLPFRLHNDDEWNTIYSSQAPNRIWKMPRARNQSETHEGYALITRWFDSETGHLLVIAAGMSARDTQSAVEFLTQEEYFGAFIRSAPSGWTRKSFQAVIHTHIHGHSPGAPVVVASCWW